MAARALCLILCERLAIDVARVQMNLIGLFHSRRFATFPTTPERFTVYAALNGEGEGRLKLIVTRLETEEDVYSFTRWFAFPDRQVIVDLEIPVTRCAFPAAGRYL